MNEEHRDSIAPPLRWGLLLLILLVIASRLIMLLRSPYPNGLDGAFYAMEFRSVMERGRLENPDWSPVFWLGGGISLLLGDAMLGAKVFSALFSGLLVWGIFLLLIETDHPRASCRALCGALLAGVSPGLAKMAVNYLNNLAGLVFCLFALLLGRRLIRRFSWVNIFGFLVLSVCTILSHRVAAVFLMGAVGLFLLGWFKGNRRGFRAFLLLLAAGPAGIGFLTFQSADLERFAGTFSLTPVLPVLSAAWRRQVPRSVLWEMSLYFCLSYGLLLYSLFRDRRRILLYAAVPLFFFPFWEMSALDMGYRLFLSSIPGGIIFVSLMPWRFPVSPQRTWLFLFLLAPAAFLPLHVYQIQEDPPYEVYLRVIRQVDLPEDSLLIAHAGLNHLYTYEKGFRDALNYIPDFPVAEDKLWRLAYGAPYGTIRKLFPVAEDQGLLERLPYGYLLIREDLWQEYLSREDREIVETLNNWYNPYRERPAFIR